MIGRDQSRESRRLRRYVTDLLRGRRPRPFTPDDEQAALLRAAITLRSARPGSGAPTEEFLAQLHRRLGLESRDDLTLGRVSSSLRRPLRRRSVVAVASAAAAVGATAAATLDHVLEDSAPSPSAEPATLRPNVGTWHTVVASAELPEGTVVSFDVGTAIGFVQRTSGQLRGVSGVCTHQGCHLRLSDEARQLLCPCHNASFSLNGAVLRHSLAASPASLPIIAVREVDGAVQVFAPE